MNSSALITMTALTTTGGNAPNTKKDLNMTDFNKNTKAQLVTLITDAKASPLTATKLKRLTKSSLVGIMQAYTVLNKQADRADEVDVLVNPEATRAEKLAALTEGLPTFEVTQKEEDARAKEIATYNADQQRKASPSSKPTAKGTRKILAGDEPVKCYGLVYGTEDKVAFVVEPNGTTLVVATGQSFSGARKACVAAGVIPTEGKHVRWGAWDHMVITRADGTEALIDELRVKPGGYKLGGKRRSSGHTTGNAKLTEVERAGRTYERSLATVTKLERKLEAAQVAAGDAYSVLKSLTAEATQEIVEIVELSEEAGPEGFIPAHSCGG